MKRGFTLLETIIAISIVLFGVISIITLMLSSRLASDITSDEFVAINLAREGVEAVRAVRDANWLAYQEAEVAERAALSWDKGLFDSASADLTAVFTRFQPSYASGEPWLSFAADDFTTPCPNLVSANADTCAAIWYDKIAERYFQTVDSSFNPDDPVEYEKTIYSRLITMRFICRDADNNEILQDVACGAGGQYVGLDVAVEVRWSGRAQTSYTLEEQIYDWKL